MVRLIAFVCGFCTILHAQQVHPALKSHESFLSEIANKKWECAFSNYPELRFFEERIEILASDERVTGTLIKLTHVEPGIIRVDFNRGSMQFFVFADDLQSFVSVTTSESIDFIVQGATAPVRFSGEEGMAPISLRYSNQPFERGGRIHADQFEALDGNGAVTATHPAYPYYPNAMGVLLPEKKVGVLLASRRQPGGWFLSGRSLGVGVRTEKSGYFRTFLASKLTGFNLRSAHFNYALLNAGLLSLADAQERYAVQLTINSYGETSEQLGACWNEMGTLRGYARSYTKAPEYHFKALEHAKKHFSSDNAKLLDYSTDFAGSQNDAGKFAAAKQTLSEAQPLLAPAGGDFRGTYLFYQQLSMAEFGLKNYSEASRILVENTKRAQEARMSGNVVESLLYLIPCQMMQNETAQANASLNQCMAAQEERSKANPTYRFDTWKLAFACMVLGRYEDAVKYAPTSQRRNSVTYQEYGRMVSLFHSGDKAGAQALAKEFIGRFGNIEEITVRNDIDPVTVKLTLAIADPSPSTVAALEQVWSEQVSSMRNRPLKNYLFAKVMVATIAKLKSKA